MTGDPGDLPADIGPTVVDAVALPGTDAVFSIVRPDDTDRLLDRAAADPEQNLPYWAELWPSGIALAAAIVTGEVAVAGTPCLEIGCGLGVTAAAALRAGADLLATDYAAESLVLCRTNCLANAGRAPATLRCNWREPDAVPPAPGGGGWPLLLAADVLYERRDVEPLLGLVERLVAPGGVLWLAEPGRPPATAFLDALRLGGWADAASERSGPWPDPKDNGVVVRVHRLTRPA